MIVELLVLAAGGLVAGAVGIVKASARSEKDARLADWQAAVSACGLTDVTVRGRTELTARRGALLVRLRAFVVTGENRGTKLGVEGVPRWLGLRQRDPRRFEDAPAWLNDAQRDPASGGVPVGDRAFDAALVVDGPEAEVLAALDAGARRRHLELFVPHAGRGALFSLTGVEPEVTVSDGRFATRRPDARAQERRDRVRVAIEGLLAVAEDWTSAVSRQERLAANARHDPLPGVRLRNLETLLRDAPAHAVVPSVLAAAREDADPEIRLTAALASGRDGHAVLRAFLSDPSTPDGVDARAIAVLGEDMDPAEVRAWLTRAQLSRRIASIAACLRALARPGRPVAPELVDALIYDTPSVREAAAVLLGNVGTSAAHVVELNRVAAMYADDAPFVRAARAAVASIQSRLVGAGHGQLAVAPDSGELSLAENPDGRVSVARDLDAS
ncbi:MAG: hypothetical protein ABW221_24870 [Vicinamibacteria bacterium]